MDICDRVYHGNDFGASYRAGKRVGILPILRKK